MQCWPALVKYPSSRSRCVHTRFFILFFVDKGELLPKTFAKIYNLRMQEQDSYKMCTILRNILKDFFRTILGHWHPCPEIFSEVWPGVNIWSSACFICLRVSCIVYLGSAHKTYSVTIYCHKITLGNQIQNICNASQLPIFRLHSWLLWSSLSIWHMLYVRIWQKYTLFVVR